MTRCASHISHEVKSKVEFNSCKDLVGWVADYRGFDESAQASKHCLSTYQLL